MGTAAGEAMGLAVIGLAVIGVPAIVISNAVVSAVASALVASVLVAPARGESACATSVLDLSSVLDFSSALGLLAAYATAGLERSVFGRSLSAASAACPRSDTGPSAGLSVFPLGTAPPPMPTGTVHRAMAAR